MRTWLRRLLVRRAAAFIAYGSAAADYLVSLGAPPDKVFRAWNTVDLEGIAATAHLAAIRRSELTGKYQLADRNLLFVGSLVERKGLRELATAALTVDVPGVDWALHVVGDGPLRDELEKTVTKADVAARFRFHGILPEQDVAELLGLVESFVLPTKREAWGLVINEAMACGVCVVVSPQAGATRDLVENGRTGFVVDPSDTKAMSAIMARLLSGDPECEAVGLAGAKAVRAKASLDEAATGFAEAIHTAMRGGPHE